MAGRSLVVPALAVLLLPLALAGEAEAQASPVRLGIGLYVLSVGNYDTVKGTYTIDFYLIQRYNESAAPAGFSADKFEFMNGRATVKERISDETRGGVREIWYRVQAALYSEPRFVDYPYDKQTLAIVIEDAVNPESALVFEPIENLTDLDEAAKVPGWRTESWKVRVDTKEYGFGESYSRVAFEILVFREPLSSTIKSFLPPAAFMLVAGLGFFMHPSKVANRIALGTGMLIAAVAFHISQTASLPPIGSLIFFDRVMLTVYSFIAIVLAVATLIAIDEDYFKETDHTKAINAWGALASVVVPFLVYLGLTTL